MGKSSKKVKYLGTVAAALLVVAPVVTTSVTPVFGSDGLTQVQAATTAGINGEFALEKNDINVKGTDGKPIYADTTLDPKKISSERSKMGLLDTYKLIGVEIQNGAVHAYEISDSNYKTPYGWIPTQPDGFYGFYQSWHLNPDKNDQTYQLTVPTNLYNLEDGTTFKAAKLTFDKNGVLKSVTADDGKTTVAPSTLTSENPLSEDAQIDPANPYLKVNAQTAQIYGDMATSQATEGQRINTDTKIVAYVKNLDGKILAYKIGDERYVKAGDVTPEATPLHEDTEVSMAKPYLKPVKDPAQIYEDMATTTPIKDQTLKTDVKIAAYVKDPDGKIVAYKIDKGQYVKASEAQDESVPLTEDINIVADKSYVRTNNGANIQIYSDAATTDAIYGLVTDKTHKVLAYVKNPDGKVVAYKIAENRYLAASDVYVGGAPLTVDANVDATKPYLKSKPGISAQVYEDPETTVPNGNQKLIVETRIQAYIRDADGNIVAYKLGYAGYVKVADAIEIPMPLTESTDIKADFAYVQPRLGQSAPIYSDMATTKKTTDEFISGKKIMAYVLSPEGETVAYKIAENQYVKTDDVYASEIPTTKPEFTEDTNIDKAKSQLTARNTQGTLIYRDNTLKDSSGNLINNKTKYPILAYVKDENGVLVGYKIGKNQYVKAEYVLVSGDDGSTTPNTNTETNATGSVTTTKAAIPYRDKDLTIVLGAPVAKGLTFTYSSVVKDANGKIVAYGFKNGALTTYLKASDVKVNSDDSGNNGGNTGSGDNNNNGNTGSDDNEDNTGNTGEDDTDDSNDANQNLTIVRIPKGQVTVSTGNKALHVYTDGATTKDSGAKLATDYDLWTVTHVAKDAGGNVVAYDLGNNQWVKASEVKLFAVPNPGADQTQVDAMPKGTAIYSNFKNAKIYSDAAATKAIGRLNTQYDEWSAYKVSKTANGNIVAYDLGNNQWVKASDLQLQKNLAGTFVAKQGTALYQADGTLAGVLGASNAYRVFAVRYINGHQALKLGNDSQWIIAATGDYYPA
ncbi:hypothetical protein FC83_GL002978 [Agrilactobacillus composti DSM 18527 = JCM 14202]|uniref:Surface layer protein A domain-containing protein n=1 Tax=Agrilactobacillus composti DSM 18527 = JCM 14202 TaxID=1423734 RepID=X0PEE6_9LACO|nr:hypothetical protein [Agrilactobacillus composti]KRM36228.1 hypothetical protein FC83_GL002978 [Agrilactobacillus composti DSM 18527 = JCM 14202]GAF39964.1 hypothetical protein JCM14202_1846 [Agrilactobacillus composti DSM 18527 = JCM 14202]